MVGLGCFVVLSVLSCFGLGRCSVSRLAGLEFECLRTRRLRICTRGWECRV